MLNAVWIVLVLGAIVCGALTGRMEEVTRTSMTSAKGAVTLALGLVGVMAFWLGMINIAREAGLMRSLARKLRPIMVRLFPEVPAEHPAMSAMIMNMAANMLGLANAATPFGLKAMMELDKLNPRKGEATNAMAQFLAINTSNVALFPTGVIAIRAAMGSSNAAGIVFTTLFATLCSTAAAIVAAKTLSRMPRFRPSPLPEVPETANTTQEKEDAETEDDTPQGAAAEFQAEVEQEIPESTWWNKWVQSAFWLTMLLSAAFTIGLEWSLQFSHRAWLFSLGGSGASEAFALGPASAGGAMKGILSFWLLPMLMAALLLYGMGKRVKVYEALVGGAREGFDVAIKIIPYLVAILVAIGMFRASGALQLLVSALTPITSLIGMPGEALPMALLRPLSGSGAYGVMAEIMSTHGPDSMIGYMVSTFQGSTETTFYVMAVYFGAVQVKKARHTLAACLIADSIGILAAVWICRVLFG